MFSAGIVATICNFFIWNWFSVFFGVIEWLFYSCDLSSRNEQFLLPAGMWKLTFECWMIFTVQITRLLDWNFFPVKRVLFALINGNKTLCKFSGPISGECFPCSSPYQSLLGMDITLSIAFSATYNLCQWLYSVLEMWFLTCLAWQTRQLNLEVVYDR